MTNSGISAFRVVSYWSGPLPAVAELHFRSFLSRTTNATYELFLENDDVQTETESNGRLLEWLQSEPRVRVHRDFWSQLGNEEVAPGYRLSKLAARRGAAGHIGSAVRRWAPAIARRLHVSRSRLLRGRTHSVGGWDFDTDSPLVNWPRWHTYRADVFRVLAPSLFPSDDYLWVDLDTCFVRDFSEWPLDGAFVYRWDDQPFGNNAIMYLPGDGQAARALGSKAVAERSFRPWVLLTEAAVSDIGITMLPAPEFDPVWDPESSIFGAPKDFMASSQKAQRIVDEIEDRCLIVHWHNQWKAVPATESPWAILNMRMSPAVGPPRP